MPNERDHSKPVVLLVDDDADLLELTHTVLEMAGLCVTTAPDGRRALQLLEVVQPDVIVTDMMMPELDGLSFLQEHGRTAQPRAPVVAVSGFEPYLDEARALGAVAALRKPYDPRQLAQLVIELAKGHQVDLPAQAPVTTEDEEARLRALFDLRLDEPATEPGMQRFLDEIAELFGVPVAGISAVTRDRQRLVTHCSAVEHDEGGPREQSFCTHAVAARAALVIQDAVENPFFRDNPSVTVRGFRFYAGVPLMPVQGEAVGTLCILDYQPHGFSAADLELLSVFAQRVLAALDRRHKAAHPEIPESAYRYLHQFDEELDIFGKALFADLIAVESARSVATGRTAALVAADLDADHLKDAVACLRRTARGGLIGRLGQHRLGVIALDRDAREAEKLIRGACGRDSRVVAVDLDRYQGGVASQALVHLEQALDAAAPTPS